MGKYKTIKIPTEAYEKEKQRINEINRKLKTLVKGNVAPVKMTQYFKLRSLKPVFIYDDELVDYFGRNKKGGNFSLI